MKFGGAGVCEHLAISRWRREVQRSDIAGRGTRASDAPPSKLEAEYQAAEVAKIAEAETLILAAVGSDPDDDVIDNGVGRRRCWSQVS